MGLQSDLEPAGPHPVSVSPHVDRHIITDEELQPLQVEPATMAAMAVGLVDRAKLSCLLCRRQFSTPDALDKHLAISELHKVRN